MPRPSSKKIKHSTNHYVYPYIRFHDRFYPLIPLVLENGRHKVKTFGLLDSGASISVFRPEIAKALKVHNMHTSSAYLGTADGGVSIGISRVGIKVGSTKFKADVGFSRSKAASFNIIGREGFFKHFSVCFNEMMKTVIMVPLKGMK